MTDFLLRRYGGNIDYVLNLEYDKFFELYTYAIEKDVDEHLFQVYCSLLPNFNKDNYMSFSEFRERSIEDTKKKIISDGGKSDEEKIKFAETIMKMKLVEGNV